jgi:hypothetical protein
LVLSKPTAVIMFPLSAIAVAIRLATKRPLEWEIGVHRAIRSRIRQLSIIAALVVVHIAFGWAALWAAYDFRYAASPAPADPAVRVYTPVQDPIDPNVMAFIRWSHRHHFLPEGFLRGVELLLGQNETQLAFMNGHWRFGGWPTFFPYTILVKTQPSKLIAFIVAAVAWVLLIRRKNVPPGWPDFAASERIYRAVPFVSLIVVYFAIALTWQMNIGFRHILPLYPAAFVLCGALSYFWNGQPWRSRAAVGTLVLSSVVSPIAVFPHYLAYFSPLAGGPKEGYKHLVDSSLDWGMDLPGLKAWVDRHNPGGELPVFLAYFGVSSPDYYHLKCFRLPSRPEWRDGRSFPLGPGIYAISATLLQGVGTRAPGPWNQVYERAWWRSLAAINHYDETLKDPAAHAALLAKIPQSAWDAEYTRFEQLRFARLCAWLRHHRPPDDNIGYSILIWRLTKEEVFAAGLGPPAELELAPIHP